MLTYIYQAVKIHVLRNYQVNLNRNCFKFIKYYVSAYFLIFVNKDDIKVMDEQQCNLFIIKRYVSLYLSNDLMFGLSSTIKW